MQKYFGTKIINAKPMNRLEYNNVRNWIVPADENPADEGYLVEYQNGGQPNVEGYAGYVSWSPKDVFESSYKAIPTGLQPHQERVAIEHNQLVERAEGLEGFIGSEPYFKLPKLEREDLTEQLEAMIWYRTVLERRMSRF